MSDEREDKDKKDRGKKVGFYIPHELDGRLKKVIPWGLQGEVHKCLLEAFVEAAEDRGGALTHQLLNGELTLMDASSIHMMNTSRTKTDKDHE